MAIKTLPDINSFKFMENLKYPTVVAVEMLCRKVSWCWYIFLNKSFMFEIRNVYKLFKFHLLKFDTYLFTL